MILIQFYSLTYQQPYNLSDPKLTLWPPRPSLLPKSQVIYLTADSVAHKDVTGVQFIFRAGFVKYPACYTYLFLPQD